MDRRAGEGLAGARSVSARDGIVQIWPRDIHSILGEGMKLHFGTLTELSRSLERQTQPLLSLKWQKWLGLANAARCARDCLFKIAVDQV